MNLSDDVLNIFKNCIMRECLKTDCEYSQLVVCINSDETGNPYYEIANYKLKEKRKVSFNEILDLKFDFKQREFIVKPYLKGLIKNFSKQFEIQPISNLKIYIKAVSSRSNGELQNKDMYPVLYNDKVFVKQLTWDEVLP